VKKFTILPAPFTIDAGELTPTLKVKRKVVNERYSAQIEAMYAD
jgi:long-chain acyl-CoA synthetase